jgi:hypothetical protein
MPPSLVKWFLREYSREIVIFPAHINVRLYDAVPHLTGQAEYIVLCVLQDLQIVYSSFPTIRATELLSYVIF